MNSFLLKIAGELMRKYLDIKREDLYAKYLVCVNDVPIT